MVSLSDIATSLDYYVDPHDSDRAWLVFGDMGGYINVLLFTSASTQLFNPPVNAWQDGLNIHLPAIEAVPKGMVGSTVVKYYRFRVRSCVTDAWMGFLNWLAQSHIVYSGNNPFGFMPSTLLAYLSWFTPFFVLIQTHIASEDEVDRSVKLVRVVPALESIISCAATSAHSLVMRGLERHDDGAHFAVPKVF